MRSLKIFPKKKTKYNCKNARKDINFIFSVDATLPDRESAFWRVSHHIAHKDSIEEHRIACRKCWRYYQKKKKEYLEEAKNEI